MPRPLRIPQPRGDQPAVDAHDIRGEALEELQRRAGRLVAASVNKPTTGSLTGPATIKIPSQLSPAYDGVLVDAPCSGSGTWRRSPHLKWTTTQETITAA